MSKVLQFFHASAFPGICQDQKKWTHAVWQAVCLTGESSKILWYELCQDISISSLAGQRAEMLRTLTSFWVENFEHVEKGSLTYSKKEPHVSPLLLRAMKNPHCLKKFTCRNNKWRPELCFLNFLLRYCTSCLMTLAHLDKCVPASVISGPKSRQWICYLSTESSNGK